MGASRVACSALAFFAVQVVAREVHCASNETSCVQGLDQLSLLTRHSSRSLLSKRRENEDFADYLEKELSKQLDNLDKIYDGSFVIVDKDEYDWKQIKADMDEAKRKNAEATGKAVTGTAKAGKKVLSILKECDGGNCELTKVAGGLLEAAGELGPVFEALFPTIAPFFPAIGVIGSIISMFSSSSSPAYPRPLSANDVQAAAEQALQKFQYDDIMAEWEALSKYFKRKTDEYTELDEVIRKRNMSIDATNSYIYKNFAQAKWWAADKGRLEDYVVQIEKGYTKFAGDNPTSYRTMNIAGQKPFDSDCSESVCKRGGIDTYRCTDFGSDKGSCDASVVHEKCWKPFKKAQENWASVLKMMNSYHILTSQLRMYQLSIFSIVSRAKGIHDEEGKMVYPDYLERGNIVWSVNNQLRDIYRRASKLTTLTEQIFSTCDYYGYPLAQRCLDRNSCGYHYAFTDCDSPGNEAAVEMVARWSWDNQKEDCQSIYNNLVNSDASQGYAKGGMYAKWTYAHGQGMSGYSLLRQGNCAEIRGDPACGFADDYHLIATPEYCVTVDACRDLFTNGSRWNLPSLT
eukprot:TRINITY_DN25851_c0_g1_i1.p1 TRINITY_DN25851_c0_g1~~TRINITY_DN25851_c0_g1_i1.p1  ORF type:complete len:574 (-),score=118.55 TRINITY_DN25851_c0_g1_i1:228-1949(-)